MTNTFLTAKKDFNAVIENAAARFARDCYRLTPCGARERIKPVIATIAFIYGCDIEYIYRNLECALIDVDILASYAIEDLYN